jgi:glyoxylase-like metal-dependent hydrolase (beta-lactamase superfamily II)/ferredoxin
MSGMARLEARLPQNVPGEFFVDSTCIDCDTCRHVAPSVFDRAEGIEQSYVFHQPAGSEEFDRALMALVACPTASIGTVDKTNAKAAAARFPEHIAANVYYCGYTSERSFGGSSYLIARPEGNVLVDSPRAAGPLLRQIEEMGGVRRMFLTHRDDVADHAKFREHFGCERTIHRLEVSAGMRDIEVQLDIREPVALDDDFTAIPVPGHTRGSVCYLYQKQFLFTGDHLWWSPNVKGLNASRSVCWYDWKEQTRSMERLLDFRFEWVLPGHGRRYRASSAAAMKSDLARLVQRMRGT